MSKRIALIVATYEYQDTGLRQLVAPAQDTEALARVLKEPEIGGFDVQELVNRPSYEVNRQIESFFTDRRLKRDDLLLFYFSGHGIKDEEGRLYFATPDTRRDQLRTTAITATLIHDVMRYSRSRRQVLILDCCYSGAFPRGMLARGDEAVGTKERFEGRGRVVLTASDSMQYAFEGDAVEGEGVCSIFTSVLVRGLETGEADLDRDGNVTLDELYDYVFDCVIDETPQQRPGKWAFDVQGDIIIARRAYPVIKPAEFSPDRMIWPNDGKEMVRVSAGVFLYGDKKREVDLPEFWIDKTPVTNAEYARFVADTDRKPPEHWKGKTPSQKIVDHPVTNVSWHDAVAYAKWAGKRLPTEQEWEKAARGTDGRKYPWGDQEPTPDLCNFDGNIGSTTLVGQYSPQGDSPYGCADMAGNVWEWTPSDYERGGKVLRGGSWFTIANHVRSAYRYRNYPGDTGDDSWGFRCVGAAASSQ
jgi:hypothetical protein